MTIRVTCDQCGSVLKIKDELAGTDGKCPKCKKRFIVPDLDSQTGESAGTGPVSDDDIAAAALGDAVKPAARSQTPSKPAKSAKNPDKPKSSSQDDDFDPVSFLMDGPRKPSASFQEDEPAPPRSPMAGGRAPVGGFSLDDDEDVPAEPPPPTKKWGARKDPAPDRAAGGSTNVARDLLAKSMEESRIRATKMPEETPRFSFDFQGFIREFGVKGLGGLAAVLGLSFGLYLMISRAMWGQLELPELGYVSGKVTIQGKVYPGIRVYFTPKVKDMGDNSKKAVQRARDSVGVTDEQGNYTLYYTSEIPGVKVGQCRVWMESQDPSVPIPPKYMGREEVTIEVLSGNNPPRDFEL